MGSEKPKADLLPGTLDMLVLKLLMEPFAWACAECGAGNLACWRAFQPAGRPERPPPARIGCPTGALSANNRRARFNELTPGGRKHLAGESARYRQVMGFA